MDSDKFWQGLRYVLIFGGGVVAGRGWGGLRMEDVGPLADSIVTFVSAAVSLATMVWGFYLRHRTKIIPAEDVRKGQLIVSPATGATARAK